LARGEGRHDHHWGRYRGLVQDMKRPPLGELLLNNVYFDTCVDHQPGIDLLTKVIPVDDILFASEMVGAVRGIDPETRQYYDDTKRYIEQVPWLSPARKRKIFEEKRAQDLPAPRCSRWVRLVFYGAAATPKLGAP
jgi:4-oxalmesaconate hydratase